MSGTAGTHESLLRFLYRSPVALLQTSRAGTIELITPMAARFLMAMSRGAHLDKLFDVLETQHPALRAEVAAFAEPRGVVCDGVLLRIADGRATHALSMCMLLTDQVGADGGLEPGASPAADPGPRLLVLLNDISVPAPGTPTPSRPSR